MAVSMGFDDVFVFARDESDMFQADWNRQPLADAGTGDGSVHWIWAEYGPPVHIFFKMLLDDMG